MWVIWANTYDAVWLSFLFFFSFWYFYRPWGEVMLCALEVTAGLESTAGFMISVTSDLPGISSSPNATYLVVKNRTHAKPMSVIV